MVYEMDVDGYIPKELATAIPEVRDGLIVRERATHKGAVKARYVLLDYLEVC